MDFARILEVWEKQNPASAAYNKDEQAEEKLRPGEQRSSLLKMKSDAFIDLHGLSRSGAWAKLEIFFEESRLRGYKKVKIIHGKGNHSDGNGASALRELSRRFIEQCPFAGESGPCRSSEGGSGATWVVLKKRPRL